MLDAGTIWAQINKALSKYINILNTHEYMII
jgi:hypothetical protein